MTLLILGLMIGAAGGIALSLHMVRWIDGFDGKDWQ